MQQREFKKLVKHSLSKLKRILVSTGLDYDTRQDIVATVLDRVYRSKRYAKLNSKTAYGYLSSRVRYAVSEYRIQEQEKNKRECQLPDDSESHTLHFVESHSVPVSECPFCFNESLNDLGTCHLCHTAIPSNVVLHRGSVSIESVSLSADNQTFLRDTDINLALSELTDVEQKVVKACIMGNESLESFGDVEKMNRKTLWRVWVKARSKLQEKLAEYA